MVTNRFISFMTQYVDLMKQISGVVPRRPSMMLQKSRVRIHNANEQVVS